jgi:ABC-2 type transport system permease protein
MSADITLHNDAEPKAAPQHATEIPPARVFLWAVRRELWEYRFLYVAPLLVAGLTLAGYVIATLGRALSTPDLAQRRAILEERTDFAAAVILFTAVLAGIFYLLDALQAERRDRSILFWKSLPVSDSTTVLAKFTVGAALAPLIGYAVTFAVQFLMLLIGSAVMLANGFGPGPMWERFFAASAALLYHMVTVHILWWAPLYAWLLLVSAAVRHIAFVWAALPVAAIIAVEHVMFGTKWVPGYLLYRISGGMEAMVPPGKMPMDPMTHYTPMAFLLTPGLWGGLAVAALFLYGASRLRRARGPM